jgi:hypothetical protein
MRKLIYLLLAILAYNQLHSGWIAQQSNTTEEFRDVFFEIHLGWAVGNAGEISQNNKRRAIGLHKQVAQATLYLAFIL